MLTNITVESFCNIRAYELMLYISSLYKVTCQLHLSKAGEEK